jgi:RimJ/RimL family protein N-acetyltransferase
MVRAHWESGNESEISERALKAAIPSHPDLQIAWQLARRDWGQGLATEGALAVLDYAWVELGITEIVAITAAVNTPSRRLMVKIGMHYEPADDFLHPDIPVSHPLRPHVLYRINSFSRSTRGQKG